MSVFLLYVYLLDLLKIAAGQMAHFWHPRLQKLNVMYDEFQITQSNNSLLLGDKAMQIVVIILMSHMASLTQNPD